MTNRSENFTESPKQLKYQQNRISKVLQSNIQIDIIEECRQKNQVH